jgi:hypothetical protein
MNRWNIPNELEHEILARDQSCIYCGVEFLLADASFGSRPSWEHIINDAQIISRENIARCCRSCNASKGINQLAIWLESPYCKQRGINKDTVAAIVRSALELQNDTYANESHPTTPTDKSFAIPPRSQKSWAVYICEVVVAVPVVVVPQKVTRLS